MSNMVIAIIAVEVGTAKSKAGKDYEFVEVTFKNKSFQDKVESKKHNQYGDKTVFSTLKSAQNGDVFTILRQKEGDFWQWIGIEQGANSAPTAISTPKANVGTSTGASAAPKSNFETTEERAKRQVYIIKQSSLSTAVAALKTDKKALSADEVIDFAKVLEAYVFGLNLDSEPTNKLPNLEEEDDIPY